MPRFRVDHLVDEYLEASCGFDPFCGFSAEVQDVRRTQPHLIYDKTQAGYDHERPLLGVLRFLEHHGFIVCLEDALIAIQDGEEDVPSGVQRTIDVVIAFKVGGGLIQNRFPFTRLQTVHARQ